MIEKKKSFYIWSVILLTALFVFIPIKEEAVASSSSSFTITVQIITGAAPSITSPTNGKTVGTTPTIIGTAEPGDNVIIKGTVGGVPLQQVASTTADANGNFRVTVSTALSTGANSLTPYLGAISGISINIIVDSNPTTDEVPTITSPTEGASITSNPFTVNGFAAPNTEVRIQALDANGNLVLNCGSTTSNAVTGAYSISCDAVTNALAAGTNALTVTTYDGAGGAITTSDTVTVTFTDPFGIVFDSVSNNPIGGATVTLYYNGHIASVAAGELAPGDVNPVITGANGAFAFNVVHPPNVDLNMTVTASGYAFPTTKADADLPAGRVILNPASVPPGGSKGEVWAFAGAITNLDLPMDSTSLLLKIEKNVNKKEVVVGDIVTYTVTIKNETASDVTDVYLEDITPAGFKYIEDRAILDNQDISNPTGNRPILFNIGAVSSGQTRVLKYQLVVGSGVTTGNYKNSAVCKYSDGTIISNKDSETVKVILDPLFDLGTIIGKVFWDGNENGIQDEVQSPTSKVQSKGGEKDGVSIREVGSMAERDGFDGESLQDNEEFSREGTIRDDISDAKSNGINTVEYSRGTGSLSQQDIHSVPLSSEGLSIRSDYTTQDSISTSISSAKGDGEFTESMQRDSRQNQQSNQFPKEVTFDIGHTTYDKQETGIANVQIVMEDGTIVTTDADGKYHVPAIIPGRHVLRIDERTLPEGAYLTTDKVVIVDITPGILAKVNFGVNSKDRTQITEDRTQITENKTEKKNQTGSQSPVIAESGNDKAISKDEIAALTSSARNDTQVETEIYTQHIKMDEKTSSVQPRTSNEENRLFFVVMGDAKAGYNFNTGDMEPVGDNDKFKDGFWSEGKFAYYLKGKIKGKYLITSSLDTEREQKELFRNLDPDKYYPVYGDASTINYDATNTQGPFYLLIEWDKSKVLWGNYGTGLTDAEFAQFSRTLYGGKIHLESVSATKFGEPNTKFIVFDARALQRAAHNEFLGTGGSLFYLKHSDIIEGSEKIKIEIRDKITGLVLTTKQMQEGFDYEIDYSNGRVIFGQPVSSIVESSSIISSQLLDGNSVYVVVDYEYETKDNYDKGVQGARLEQSLSDYVTIGGTYVKEEQQDEDYELKGMDVTIHLGENITVTAEQAESESEQAGNFISTDGGLSFTELTNLDADKGKAYGIKAEAYLFDKLGLTNYYKKIEKGFSSTSAISQQGKELFGAGLTWDINSKTKLAVSHDVQKLIEDGNPQTQLQVGAQETKTTTAQVTHQMEKLQLTGEYRHQEVTGKDDEFQSQTNRNEDVIAAKVDYKLTEKVGLSLEQQVTLKDKNNNQTSVGISAQPNERLLFKAKQTVGTEGSATSIGAAVNVDAQTDVNTTFAVAESIENGQTQSVVIGSQQKLNEELTLTADRTYAKNEDTLTEANTFGVAREKDGKRLKGTFTQQQLQNNTETSNTNIFGLSGDINDKWALAGSFEHGTVQNHDGTQATRNAGALGIGYTNKDAQIKTSSKLEFRNDEGDENKQQYLVYNALEYKPTINTTLFAKTNISQTENTSNNSTEAQYKELTTGLAYRPIYFDRLNFLARYTYLEDTFPQGQSDFSDIEEERAHTIAGELAYDLNDKLQLVEKLAYKFGEEKVTGFDFTKTQTWLNIHRLNYKINNDWQFGAEYRILTQRQAEDSKQGALIEVNRKIGEFVQMGVGYNFTDFSDDLTHLDYTSQGPFIRLTAMLYDRTPEEIERARQKALEEKIKQWVSELVNEELAKPNSPIMQKLHYYNNLAEKFSAEGKLKEAKEIYERIARAGEMMYNNAEKYIRERIELEEKIKEENQLALEYYKQGKLKEAKEIWEKITQEAKPETISLEF